MLDGAIHTWYGEGARGKRRSTDDGGRFLGGRRTALTGPRGTLTNVPRRNLLFFSLFSSHQPTPQPPSFPTFARLSQCLRCRCIGRISLWMMSPSQGQHETECSRFESKPRARRTADRVQCAIASLLSLHHADSATDSTTAPRQPPIPADIRPAGALDISSSSFASHAISSFRSIATSFPSLI